MIRKYTYLNIIAWFFIIVIPHLLQQAKIIDTDKWLTHSDNGPISILTGTFLHGHWNHLVSNLSGMIVGTAILAALYRKMYWQVISLGIIIPSTLSYLGERPVLGISGLLYAVIWFLIVRGLMSRDYFRFLVGILMALFYGNSMKGAVPLGVFSQIAWWAHLAGMVTGAGLAIYSRIRRN